ncbi:MAG: hypothetical protein V7765_14985 [Oleispira sp.]
MSDINLLIQMMFMLAVGFAIGQSLTGAANRSGKILDKKVDAIIEHLGISFDPYKNLPSNILDELKLGNKIKAIKLYRAFSGAGLKEAKEAIEIIESRQ